VGEYKKTGITGGGVWGWTNQCPSANCFWGCGGGHLWGGVGFGAGGRGGLGVVGFVGGAVPIVSAGKVWGPCFFGGDWGKGNKGTERKLDRGWVNRGPLRRRGTWHILIFRLSSNKTEQNVGDSKQTTVCFFGCHRMKKIKWKGVGDWMSH